MFSFSFKWRCSQGRNQERGKSSKATSPAMPLQPVWSKIEPSPSLSESCFLPSVMQSAVIKVIGLHLATARERQRSTAQPSFSPGRWWLWMLRGAQRKKQQLSMLRCDRWSLKNEEYTDRHASKIRTELSNSCPETTAGLACLARQEKRDPPPTATAPRSLEPPEDARRRVPLLPTTWLSLYLWAT